mmetsp:Transcript_5949/g.17174  ORF Transcript_5949/g.17174 Transcript_5949/m.17174 type:complete len:310 (+) Transcript_5949:3772-4701(+)
MRLNLVGTPENKTLEPREAALPQFVRQAHGRFVRLRPAPVARVVHLLVVVHILVVPARRVLRIAESEKDGDDPIDLTLTQTMPHRPGHGAHGTDERAGIGHLQIRHAALPAPGLGPMRRPGPPLSAPSHPLGQVDLTQQTLHEAFEEGVGDDGREASNGVPGPFPYDGADRRQLGQRNVEDLLVLTRDADRDGAEAGEKISQDVEAGEGDLLGGLVLLPAGGGGGGRRSGRRGEGGSFGAGRVENRGGADGLEGGEGRRDARREGRTAGQGGESHDGGNNSAAYLWLAGGGNELQCGGAVMFFDVLLQE